ncbi:PAS domain S-box protein [Allocoleopsis sp.]|uniref:PAS domain S-box protein n=1 Tax=Allocoleopsis sp. TaxID=3088169 RepID=UPI002FD3FFEE
MSINASIQLEQAINKHPLMMPSNTPVMEAIAAMSQHRSTCTLIVDQQKVVGIFTERDVVRITAHQMALEGIALSQVMTEELITLPLAEICDIFSLLAQLRCAQIRHLPILDDQGGVLGIVTPESLRAILKPTDLLQLRRVREMMTTEVITAPITASVFEVAQQMATHRKSCVVICQPLEGLNVGRLNVEGSQQGWNVGRLNVEGSNPTNLQPAKEQPATQTNLQPATQLIPVGIITERDIVKFTSQGLNFVHTSAEAVMSCPLLPIHPSDTLWQANQLMQQQEIRRLVVVDEAGYLAGIITQSSILHALDPVELYSTIELLQQTLTDKTQELRHANTQLQQEICERQLLEDKLFSSEQQMRAIFEAMVDIVLVIDGKNSIQVVPTKATDSPTWDTNLANLTVKQFLQEETRESWFGKVQQALATQQPIDFDYSLRINDQEIWFTAKISPLPDDSVVWVARDISDAYRQAELRKRAEAAEFNAINRALRVLSASIRAVAQATEEFGLLQTVCQLLIDLGEYHLAWVGYVQQDEGKTIQPVAYAGHEAGYVQRASITWANTQRGQEPTGRAIRSGQPAIAQNILTDPNLAPWREEACKRGYQSSLAVPLTEREQVFGALNLYSTRADAFDTEEVQLLTELADNVSYGILSLRAERDRQRMEEALRISEEKFAKAFHCNPLAMLITTLEEGRCLDCNQRFEDLLGYSPEETIGQTTLDLGIWPTAQQREHMIELLKSQGTIKNREVHFINKFGNARLCRLSAETIHIANKPCLLCAIEDITERRQAQAQIKFQADILSQVSNAVIALDIQKRVTFWNQAAEKLYGCKAEEIMGFFLSQGYQYSWYNPADQQKAHHALATTGTWHGENIHVRRDGSQIHVDSAVSVLRDANGNSTGLLAVIRDISDRKRAEKAILRLNQELESRVEQRTAELAQTNEQLQQTNEQLAILNQEFQRSNQELEQFAYVASHDLQEPLRAITGYTQLLVNEYGERFDETAQEYAEFVIDGAKRMQQLIQDLLAYSRVGTRGKEFAPTDCNVVLQQALQNLQVAIADNQATITADPLPTVNADQNQLIQLLQNLIGNAIKFYRNEPPQVHITAEQQDNHWLFQVRDNGIGIKPQYLERIFEVFKRLHTRREYPGTGIGLAICKKIVTRHGGSIWAKSEPGVGTTFYFTLPLSFHEKLSEFPTH